MTIGGILGIWGDHGDLPLQHTGMTRTRSLAGGLGPQEICSTSFVGMKFSDVPTRGEHWTEQELGYLLTMVVRTTCYIQIHVLPWYLI